MSVSSESSDNISDTANDNNRPLLARAAKAGNADEVARTLLASILRRRRHRRARLRRPHSAGARC